MNISVIIPTYNNPARLAETITRILESDTSGLETVEIVVVDDGSPRPASSITDSIKVNPPFSLSVIRQANAGPAAARNTGFRNSTGEIAVFIDDDILVPPSLLNQHAEAHRRRPGSVIFGRCPLPAEESRKPLARFLNSLGCDPGDGSTRDLIETDVVASGQISVERRDFEEDAGVYRDDLATPAAEEFELAERLHRLGIPILMAPGIEAVHNQEVDLGAICRQQYKHAMGCAEAIIKYPDTMQFEGIRKVHEVNRPVMPGDPVSQTAKKTVKRILASRHILRVLFHLVRALERTVPVYSLQAPLYNAVIGLHFFAGMRDGLKRYSNHTQ